MSLTYGTGLLPRRPETRDRLRAEARRECGTVRGTVVQPIPFIRDQRGKPSCVGQAVAACVDAVMGKPPWASAVDIWVDARRRQGNLEGILDGTRSEFAIESLIRRGWSSYVTGEDRRTSDKDDELPGLLRELQATDRRMLQLRHRCLFGDRSQQVIAALHAGHGVILSGGSRPAYHRPPKNTVLGLDYRSGASGGHCERIAGYDADRDAFLVQGSWGTLWTWCEVAGKRYEGCCLVSRGVIEEAWDVDVLEVVR